MGERGTPYDRIAGTAYGSDCLPDTHTVLRVIRNSQTHYECPKCQQVFVPVAEAGYAPSTDTAQEGLT